VNKNKTIQSVGVLHWDSQVLTDKLLICYLNKWQHCDTGSQQQTAVK